MIQTGWRLERTYLAGAGLPESRLEGLDINWSDPLEPTGHSALWADNGTGKTMITALRYALYLPHPRDFIRGDSDRSLAKLVRSGDVCHVVEQATRVVEGELQRVVVGMVADWSDGGTRDLDNPSKLQRMFYGWLTGPDGPTIDRLPFRTSIGRWATRAQFVNAVREVLPHGGAAPPHPPSDHQGHWREWLVAAGVDLDQIRFQAVMNASEGGVDRVMRFTDSDEFVRWLIGATMPTSTVEQITHSIDTLRRNAAARPHWADELDLWERIIDPLLDLAVAHEAVAGDRRAVATAEADAAAVIADADATVAALGTEGTAAAELHRHHDQRRRDAGAMLRRTQAHRLRMQLRAAELRVQAAEKLADRRREDRDDAARALAAWQLVGEVLDAKATRSKLAGLEERLEAVEKQTEQLRREEKRHRQALARLLTYRRDAAEGRLKAAKKQSATAVTALEGADKDLQSSVSQHATAAEQVRQLQSQVTESEQAIAEAVTAGLLTEGADPARVDASLIEQIAGARRRRDGADEALKDIDNQVGTAQDALSSAQRRAATARDDRRNAERELNQITQRLDALAHDERLLDVVGHTDVELWTERTSLTDALLQRAKDADAAAAEAREAMATAQRIVDSVGSDGLLPPSVLAETVARRCQDAELPAWPGWRWLADTMTPDAAEAFAAARPEIASGVVVAHPDLVGRAIDAIGDLDLDVAVWVGAVLHPSAAMGGDADGSTRAHVLLPPAGIFDRDAARDMVASATESLAEASRLLQAANKRGTNARAMLAALEQLWTDLPGDPRRGLAEKINSARERQQDADRDEQAAQAGLDYLAGQRREQQHERETAQRTIDTAADTRLRLAPVIAAAETLTRSRAQLPPLRDAVAELRAHIDELRRERPQLVADVEDAKELERIHTRDRDDAAEALRVAGLSATTEGPVPTDDDATIRARLESIEAVLGDAAVDPALHEETKRARQRLADLNAKLGSNDDQRVLAEQFAASDGARHPVALAESKRTAQEREALSREAYAKAEAAAEAAIREYQERADDVADRSSPDVEGFPPTAIVAKPSDADRFARQLDDLATQLLERQRTEERLAREAQEAIRQALESTKLVETSAKPLRHLADPSLTGRRADDTDQLIERVNDVAERVRATRQTLSNSEQDQHRAANAVRAHANSPQARKVEEREDPRVVDLILRLRADDHLPAEAERIAGHLEQRAATLRDDLNNHDHHVRTCATMLHVQAATAIQRLRAYQNQSRLPDGLGDWSEQRFVVIDHETVPSDESVAVDRVARVVHALLAPGAGRSDAQAMLFAAARALVDAPFRVRLLKPHTDLALDRADVAELKNFSGGQRVTAGVLLYATMTRVRAAGDATSIGWLWLDNPFGQASADQFVRTMRLAADRLGLQLVFTAAPKDKGALSMFDRIVALARRSRPSSGEKVVVIDKGTREIADLTLVQKDVMAVLGE
jgi:hypothetical protein